MDTLTMENKNNEIFEDLKQFISDIIGADIVEELNIIPESSFTRDLEMDSIEIVAFSEKVKTKYGDVDFATWLSGMDIDQIIGLSLNDVIIFIANVVSKDK